MRSRNGWTRLISWWMSKDMAVTKRRRYELEIDAGIAGGCLQVRWTYSRNMHSQAVVDRLAWTFKKSVQRLLSGRVPGDSFVPADFPFAKLDGPKLTALVKSYGAFQDVYSLSAIQEGMLFHALSTGDAGAFCERLTCTLQGKLDIDLFRQSWQRVIDRHTILRTCFVWNEYEVPLQVVLPKA